MLAPGLALPAAVKELVDKGANVNDVDSFQLTALHNLFISSSFVSEMPNDRLLVGRLLVESGGNVKSEDVYGNTPLHASTFGGYEDMAKLLVESGCDINATNLQQETPLLLAMKILLSANTQDHNI